MPINVKDASGATVAIETPNANGRAAAAASKPVALSTEDKAALDAILAKIIAAPATEATAAQIKSAVDAVTAKLIAAPATEALQSAGNTTLSAIQTALGNLGTQATLAAILAKIIAAPATEARQVDTNALLTSIGTLLTTQAGFLDGVEALLATIGTRAYGAPLTRLAVGSTSAQSAAVTATEVLLHASTRCFVATGASPAATTSSIPLEAGEKFHLRVTSGHLIAAIRDTADGFLNIIPVA